MSRSLEEFQEIIRGAPDLSAPLRIIGWGTWTSAYQHPSAVHNLSFADYAGVQEYVPGNLTMTVRAGTTLTEIAEVAAAENQWLPLDPFGHAQGTVGATVATCSYGPLATAFGTPRDLMLGVEAILGTGEVVRGGGRVVKNVAGYDLTRLFTGSWGVLGAITEVTLRLFAKQETEVSVALPLPEKRDAAAKLLATLRSISIYPWAMELLDGTLARALNIGTGPMLVFRFGGNENLVRSQMTSVESLGGSNKVDGGFWKQFSTFPAGWSLRLSGLPTRLLDTWDAAARLIAIAGSGFRSATPERGTVRIFFPADIDAGKLFTALGQFVGGAQVVPRIVVEAMPSVSPLSFSDRGAAHNQLIAGIKRVFDPHNTLNPGFLPQ
jgi:glycolate oxidase FAD binding subunit